MSYFSDMVGRGETSRKFMWEVNCQGEIVVHRLDGEGKILRMACMRYDELQHLFEKVRLVSVPVTPGRVFNDANTWEEICDILNSPGRKIAKGKINSAMRAFNWNVPISYDTESKKWKVDKHSPFF